MKRYVLRLLMPSRERHLRVRAKQLRIAPVYLKVKRRQRNCFALKT